MNSEPLSLRRNSGVPCSWMAFSPRSASPRIRILSSVVYRLPSMSGAFLCWPQTNTSHGPNKRGHVTPGKFAIHRRRPAIPTTVFSKHGKDTAQRGFKKPLPCPQKGVEREPDEPDAKAILPEPRSVQKANSYQWLKDHLSLYGVKNAILAPGYRIPESQVTNVERLAEI